MRLVKFMFVLLFSASAGASALAQAPKPTATSGTAAVRTVDIFGNDEMKYSLTTITAKPGETIRIRMISKGVLPKIAMAHNVVVVKPGTDLQKFLNAGAPFRDTDFIAPAMQNLVIAKTPFAGPGEMTQVVFKVPAQPGKYPYLCTFAGHFMAGMTGTLIVK